MEIKKSNKFPSLFTANRSHDLLLQEFLADYGMVWVGGGCYGDYDDNDVGVATATWNPGEFLSMTTYI